MNYRILVTIAAWSLMTSMASANDERAIRALQSSGARVERDESHPEKPLVSVKYNLRELSERGLQALTDLQHLPALELVGSGDTEVRISTLQALQGKTSLRSLAISNAKLSDESAEVLGSLQSLNVLHLKANIECSSEALAEIFRLKHLKELTLSDRLVSDSALKGVCELPDLKVLNIRSIFVTDQGLASLVQMHGLQTLRIFLGPDVTGTGLQYLGSVPVRQLEITYFNISDTDINELSRLTTITSLHLMNAKNVTDAALPALAEIKGLKELEIVGGNFTKTDLTLLKKRLKGCVITEGVQ